MLDFLSLPCFRVSVYLSVLISCYELAAHQLHPWRFELDFFASCYPVDSPTNSALKQTPFGIPP